jgi:ADP-dependent NAD(P)H-hydrate dehydratase / NAD(P)H-hydrate epimerase
MSAVTIAEALELEAIAKANGWSEEQLLDLAGQSLGQAIGLRFPHPGTAIAYLGKGHNAGDTLVALRILRDQFGWKIAIRHAYNPADVAPLTQTKWLELGECLILHHPPILRHLAQPLLLLDGLLGTGSRAPLKIPLLTLAREMNSLRRSGGARVAAIDLPSGINSNSGLILPDTVTADATFMIANAKCALLNGHAASSTGSLAVVTVEPLTATFSTGKELICPQKLNDGKTPRPFDFHKGMAGRVAILAGSESYAGAAVLAASGALRGGAGLVTLFVPRSAHSLISAKCPPEVIVRVIENPREILKHRFDALVVGCGLGGMNTDFEIGLLELIRDSLVPAVIDADALSLIARLDRFDVLQEQHILTPHPGEFSRLAADLADLSREASARKFADRCPATLLLKGCRTIVTRQGEPLWCNATGTPGMATGGQGDLLAGVIGARLAIGETPLTAASLSAWICGRSAEIALEKSNVSEESLTPSDSLNFIGAAFQDWKTASR